MKRLRRLLQLPTAERWLLAKTALLLSAIRVGLWVLPFQTLRRLLATVAGIPIGLREADQSSVEKVVWAVESAGRHLPVANTCLTQALATQVLLVRRGQSPLVRIGVAKGEGGQLEAHAWVESGGEVIVGGHDLERYTSLVALDEGSL